MVITSNSDEGSPGLIPWRSQINYISLPQNWCVETMGEGDYNVMCKGRQLSLPE